MFRLDSLKYYARNMRIFLILCALIMPVETAQQEKRQQAILQIFVNAASVARLSWFGCCARGIEATQSSVSRDLRQLGITKLADGYQQPDASMTDSALPPEEYLRGVDPAGPWVPAGSIGMTR